MKDLLEQETKPGVAQSISDRLSKELVIALVGPVGSGVSTAAEYIVEILKETFSYQVCPILQPSTIIRDESHRVGLRAPEREPLDEYIIGMQTAGNLLRQKFGNNYLAEKVVERIFKYRHQAGGFDGDIVIPGRRAYIIDSMKNTEELELFRQLYGDTVCIFGIFAPDSLRRERLISDGAAEEQVKKLIDRDQNEIVTFGQKTRKIFIHSDFFVCNDQKKDQLRTKLARYLDLIFDTSVHTPTRAESAMYEASAAAANSACMSRQVGASIVSSDGELIAIGWNDVPRVGGGLYCEDDQSIWDDEKNAIVDRDYRCFKWGGSICHNEIRRKKIVSDIINRIVTGNVLKRGITAADIAKLTADTEIDSLIEYSRSIHAEMGAILSVAREGRHSLFGSTLYTNTYPCHNCARHIVASGISSVVYIEPYVKSLATTLHSDAVTENPTEKNKVVFRQYDGVAPRNFLRLFRPSTDRKKAGKLARPPKATALPIFRKQLDAQADYESKIVADLARKEQDSDGDMSRGSSRD